MRVLLALLFIFIIPLQANAEVPYSKEQIKLSYAPLVKKIAPAVVNIYTKRIVTQRVYNPFIDDPFFSQFFGRNRNFGNLNRQRVESALGSGVIVDKNGLIVTNSHVIKGASEITVVLADGREFEAELIVSDAKVDLALLKIDGRNNKLPVAELRASEDLEVGDLVLAIGNPFGVGQTVTSGIVSAVARSALSVNDFNFFIQTDAAINPGNSGGALVAMDGGVVGINTAIYSRDGGSLGIGFAIPSEMVATLIAAQKSGQISSNGFVRPWLGVTSQNLTSDIAESLGMEKPQGAMIVKLHDKSPLKAAGVEVGDVVISIDNRPVKTSEELRFRMSMVPIGEKANITVLRNGKEKNFKVKSMPPSNEPPANQTKIEGDNILSGAVIANLNPALAYELGMSVDQTGIVITEIENRSYSSRFLQVGDILMEINGKEIKSIDDVKKSIKKNDGYWKLVFQRGGHVQTLVLR